MHQTQIYLLFVLCLVPLIFHRDLSSDNCCLHLSPLTVGCFNSNLLDSKADGIEVSYNACGVLSHIMFDGPEVWSMEEPRRDTVMDKMWDAIQSWDVSSRRNINYR